MEPIWYQFALPELVTPLLVCFCFVYSTFIILFGNSSLNLLLPINNTLMKTTLKKKKLFWQLLGCQCVNNPQAGEKKIKQPELPLTVPKARFTVIRSENCSHSLPEEPLCLVFPQSKLFQIRKSPDLYKPSCGQFSYIKSCFCSRSLLVLKKRKPLTPLSKLYFCFPHTNNIGTKEPFTLHRCI